MATIMQAVGTCPDCGSALHADAPGGLCPACLSRVTFGLGGGVEGNPLRTTATSVAKVPERLRAFGDFELLEEIGRGGMGVVYRARQRSLDRIVAVKMILAGHFAGEKDVQRFRAEAQSAAKLRHPNIVTIFEVGEHDGQPYFSMEYVEGQPLSERVRTQPWPVQRAAECLRTIASAMHYAHSQGLVHRDLKPANILLDAADTPRITDFGLAKRMVRMRSTASHSDSGKRMDEVELVPTDLTLTGQTLGSPSYMSPEQAVGKSALAGPLSDVYSLGAILYHLVTGRPPFQGESLQSILLQVQNAEPVSPRLLNPNVPRDLETICLRCLEKEPADRYDSARELAAELDRFLRGEAIWARPNSAPERLWRWCRRRPAVAALSTALVVLLVAVAIGSSRAAWRIATARDEAVRERDRAESTLAQLELQRAEALLEAGDSAAALALLARRLRQEPTNRVAASWIADILGRYSYALPVTPPLEDPSGIVQARFSPDGRRVATASWGGARIWDARDGRAVTPRVRFSSNVHYVEFSPDGKRLACASWNGTARILDAETGADLTPAMVHGNYLDAPVFSVRFSPDGNRVATSTRAKFARVWSAETGEPLTDKLMHADEVNFADFSPDGRRLVTASEDHTAVVWDAQTGQPMLPPMRHNGELWMARFSPDGTLIATASRDGTVRIWNANTGEPVTEPLKHLDWVEFVEFSPDGSAVVTCSYDRTARVWDARTGLPRTVPLRHNEQVVSAKFSPDGATVLTASTDGTARIWSVSTGEPLLRAIQHPERIYYAEFSPDGTRVVTASRDRMARIWELKRPPAPEVVLKHETAVFAAEYSPSGDWLATASYDGAVRLWDAQSAKQLLEPMPHPKSVFAVKVSPNGRWLGTLCRDGAARIWDTRTGSLQLSALPRLRGFTFMAFTSDDARVLIGDDQRKAHLWDLSGRHQLEPPFSRATNSFQAGAVSPDGQFVALGSVAGYVSIFDARTRQPIGNPLEHEGAIRDLQFTPDGRLLLTASVDGAARVWNLSSGQLHTPPLRHHREVWEARFDTEARRIVTASVDGTARVWDAHTGQPLTGPLSHRGKVNSARFSPDGTRVLTASEDGTARIWDAHSGEPLTPPWTHGGPVTSARFSPDGKSVLTASRDGTARIWQPPNVTLPVPMWFPSFVEAMIGQRLNDTSAFEFVPADEMGKIKEQITLLPAADPYAAWARRF